MMATKQRKSKHTGTTAAGNTRDTKVERVGRVTIYQRGRTYYLYYREGKESLRRKVDCNLAAARATAHKVADALLANRPSPIAFTRTSPQAMVAGFLDAVTHVKQLALRTQDRYRAALDRFLDFCQSSAIPSIDAISEATIEDFVKWLRGQRRTRNGAARGTRSSYASGGIRFILSTCRTAFNWAARHRMLPPYSQNPFAQFGSDQIKDRRADEGSVRVFTREQEQAFFAACDSWQRPLFSILAAYGLRVGELTHLLIEDVDFDSGIFSIRSKPWLSWRVKTGRERQLPLLPGTKEIFAAAIDGRAAGFVFVSRTFANKRSRASSALASAQAVRAHAARIVSQLLAENPSADERQQRRRLVAFCRAIGQIPATRLRLEFMGITNQIGCPEFTRVHDFRHLFTTRAQAAGVNPIIVQDMLGHTTLEMTRRYSHPDIETKRQALGQFQAPS